MATGTTRGPLITPAPSESAPPELSPRRNRLTGTELVTLQLLARGYSLDQIARLRRVERADVAGGFQQVLTALGVSTVREAVVEAQERRLIL